MREMTTFVRDNIEAFAIAIAMALVIRHFSVEAFRIPTGSMMPTLYGDSKPGEPQRHGDRILVDKFLWMRQEPRRWQVAVFQFPLDRNINFIKRLVGLPGEWFGIANGDIWTSKDGKNWSIERKPPGVREQLFFPYWPRPRDGSEFEGPSCWEGPKDWAVSNDSFAVDASESGTTLQFARTVLTYPEVDRTGSPPRAIVPVGDIRFSSDIEFERPGDLEFRIREHGVVHRLVLGIDESFVEVGGQTPQKRALDVRVERGESYSVSFANVDDSLVLEIDGNEVIVLFETRPEGLGPDFGIAKHLKRDDHGFSIVARGCKATFSDPKLDRDMHYLSDRDDDSPRRWKIPEGHFFACGDNTNSSKDSRAWRVAQIVLTSGETIEWETGRSAEPMNPSASAISTLEPDDEFVIPVDSQGLLRRIRRSDIASWEHEMAWPYVPRDHLIGRAFGVFWPIYVPPIYRGSTRIKRIR